MADYKKLYEDAIFRMNKWVEGSEIIDPKEVAEFVFPELKESEDEKIRKEIIDFVVGNTISKDGRREIYLAWLEKQSEKLPVGFYYVNSEGKKFYSDTFKYGDFTFHVENQGEQIPADKVKSTEHSYTTPNSEFFQWIYDRLVYVHNENPNVDYMLSLKERIEDMQNPTDKIEPKFKVGDWVVYNDANVYQVKEIDYTNIIPRYELENIDGDKLSIPFTSDYNLRNWTIEDAKDGNVLATNYFIFIFKNIDSNNGVHYYCQYEISKHEDDNQFDTALPQSLMGKVGSSHYSPATKEQREQLEKAMTDAGYTFDSDKKELKKIEQGNSPLLSNYSNNRKNAWSEEDENLYTLCESAITTRYNDGLFTMNEYKQTSLWLKSLKDRI